MLYQYRVIFTGDKNY